MSAQKRRRNVEWARAASDPLCGSPLGRDAQYDGIAFSHYLHRVMAKRLFKAGV